MQMQYRNNVRSSGSGNATLIFSHGFGCDQSMWRLTTPAFEERFRIVCFDLVGSGRSDRAAYDKAKYASLHGHASDVLEIVDSFGQGPVVFVGHSVSSMIGMLAVLERPEAFAGLVMVAPSPCFINDDDYVGGFNREDVDGLLAMMEQNFGKWAGLFAPMVMGAPNKPELQQELCDSFLRNDPVIARHFAEVTFLADHRADLPRLQRPTLIMQASDDLIAPREVGQYMRERIPCSQLVTIDNIGHCPQMSASGASARAILDFVSPLLLESQAAVARRLT
ncbi:MAG: alpha/beta hydrolase [Pseudomonadota bacterium]